MVSGNSLDFNALSEADKQGVAERLLRIKESGWKPFWCSLAGCEDGSPHPLLDASGAVTFTSNQSGPNGEPVGPYYERPDGERFVLLDQAKALPHETHIGYVVLDPKWAHNHARVDQRLLPWMTPWTLFIMSGRGTGKTRTGVEFVTLHARRGLDGAILGRRGTELVNTHVAEILAHAHPEFTPIHWASKDLLEWPNGAKTYLFSAEKPENIRSVNLGYAWVDEAAFMDEIETAWMNLKMATRIDDAKNPIHYLITSTPTPTKWVMEMEDDDDVEVRRVSTYVNRANLSASFLADLEKKYEGTRMGRQELHGEVLRDVEGSLWNDDIIKHHSLKDSNGLGAYKFAAFLESMDDRVLAIDPAGSSNKRSDLTGIIGIGSQHSDDTGAPLPASTFWVIGDATLKGTPSEWAAQAFKAARLWKVNRIIVEKNFGGEMVEQTLRDYAKLHPDEAKNHDGEDFRIEVVHASQSKETRAEPTVGKYEQGRVTHVISDTPFGDLSALEKEQVTWIPKSRGGRLPSPNRIDALVWAMRALETNIKYAASSANQAIANQMRRSPFAPTNVRDEAPKVPETAHRPAPEKPKEKVWESGAKKRFPSKPKMVRVA